MIGCRGNHLMQRAIITIKGGNFNLSHVSTVVRDVRNEGTGRVEVMEAISHGMDTNYLSQIYEASHGLLFWMPMDNTKTQQKTIMEMAARMIETPTKYDLWAALTAPFQGFGFVLDIKKFNCSESWWYLQTACGRLSPVFNKKGQQIAPVPGDCPAWAQRPIFQLDMQA